MDNDVAKLIVNSFTALSTREVAIGIWLLVIFVCGMFFPPIRSSIVTLFHAVLQKQLIVIFACFALNVSLIILVLSKLSLWTLDQLAPTILWYFLSGIALVSQVFHIREDQGYFRKLALSGLSIVGVFEFLVVASTCGLIVELVLVPILALVGGVYTMVSIKKEYTSVKTFLEVLLIGFTIFIVWVTIAEIWQAPEEFFTTSTGRNFIMPGLLSLGSIPFLYGLYCFSHLERAKFLIGLKTFQPKELKDYAYKRFKKIFVARPWLLKRAVRQFQSLPANSREDVDEIIQNIYQYERDAENPPEVAPRDGWSPYLAREYLAGFELRTKDYHKGFDEEYWAESEYIDLDENILTSMAVYSIEGHNGVVTTLKLSGRFHDGYDTEPARQKLSLIASRLIHTAIEMPISEALVLINQPDTTLAHFGNTRIRVLSKRYPSGRGEEVSISLERGKENESN